MGKLVVITGLDGSGTSTVGDQLHFEDPGSSLLKSPPYPFSSNRHDIDEKLFHQSPTAHYLYYLASNVQLTTVINEKMAEHDGNIYCIRQSYHIAQKVWTRNMNTKQHFIRFVSPITFSI